MTGEEGRGLGQKADLQDEEAESQARISRRVRRRPESPGAARFPQEGSVAARERLALTGQLAAGVAHAINNPLAYVMTNIAYCKERLDYIQALLLGEGSVRLEDPRLLRGLLLPLSEALEEAAMGSSRVGHLARNLKSLSDAPSGDEVAGLEDALESALLTCEGACRHRAKVRTDCPEGLRVWGTTASLAQIIANLIFSLVSTFEHNSPSSNRVSVRAQPRDDWITVELSDNGPGLSPRILSTLETANLQNWTKEDGPVLWLLSAQRLTETLGGTLTVLSTRGPGARFRVHLRGAQALIQEKEESPPPPKLERKARILVVDNEPLIVRAITRFLGHDFDVDSAADGREALEVLRAAPPPDLVLCDLLMPEMTGMELYQRVLEKFPTVAQRFAFLTGGAYSEETTTFLAGSERPTLHKPLEPKTLRRTVRELLKVSENSGQEADRPNRI